MKLLVQGLNRIHHKLAQIADTFRRRLGAPDRCIHRHPRLQTGGANRTRVVNRAALFFNRVDDQGNLVVLDHVNDMRTTFGYFVHRHYWQAGSFDGMRRATRGDQMETSFVQMTGDFDGLGLVTVLDRQENLARRRQLDAGRQLRLDEGFGKSDADAHDFPGSTSFPDPKWYRPRGT